MELASGEEDIPAKASSTQGDYEVGYGRPPVHSRYRPGQSGNPNGRPKGRLNVKTELGPLLSRKVPIRHGETDLLVSLVAANVLAQGQKGAEGDSKATQVFFNGLRGIGLLDPGEDTSTEAGLIASATKPRASEWLFADLDADLLSRDDFKELSRLADVVDLGGGIAALSMADFEQLQHIVNKGRGRDVTPQ